MQTSGFEHGHWGLLVVDAGTKQVIYEQNADQMFCPASVTKLFSTAAALEKLGPDYRFVTPVRRKGEIGADGVLKGDLVLVASGDMAMGGRTGPDGKMLYEDNDHTYGGDVAHLVKADALHGLKELARGVAKSGIKEVSGNVLVDDRLFAPAASSGSGPRNVSAITINDNMVDMVISAGKKAGDLAEYKMVPENRVMAVDFQVKTVEKGKPLSVTIRTLGPRSVTVYGSVPEGHKDLLRNFEVAEPASWARSLFIECLRAEGVKVTSSSLAVQNVLDLPSKAEVAALPKVAEYDSLPLAAPRWRRRASMKACMSTGFSWSNFCGGLVSLTGSSGGVVIVSGRRAISMRSCFGTGMDGIGKGFGACWRGASDSFCCIGAT